MNDATLIAKGSPSGRTPDRQRPSPLAPRHNHGCPEEDARLEAWVRKVNATWLVHAGLRECAAAYMDHLAEADAPRLMDSCRVVREMLRTLGAAEDPKPRFYAGLFSLATQDEALRFLSDHHFTLSLIPAGRHLPHPSAHVPGVCEKVKHLRAEIHKCVMAVQATP